MQSHRYVDLPQAKGSFGYLPSDTAPSRLVVFVHGFAGDAWATWVNFHIAIMSGKAGAGWSSSDVIFYDYPSIGSRIDIAAGNFATFFSSLVPPRQSAFRLEPDDSPAWVPRRQTPAHREAASYDEIVLIGHSEGAVIVRQAVAEVARLILDAGRSPSSLAVHQTALLEAKLRLFAPAIAGAGPAGLKGAALRTPLIGHLASIFLGSSRAYSELQPTSRVLEKLEERTERYWKSKNYPGLKAAIAWGAREDVVELVNYDQDDPIWREPGHNHVSICKPVGAFDKPLAFADTGAEPT